MENCCSANNDLTGRRIVSSQTKELIVQLHNEVRSKIARGACGQVTHSATLT